MTAEEVARQIIHACKGSTKRIREAAALVQRAMDEAVIADMERARLSLDVGPVASGDAP